jgi:hypothetical protein
MCTPAWTGINTVFLGASPKVSSPTNSKALVQPRGMQSTATASIHIMTGPWGHCSAAPGVTVITVQQQLVLVLEPGCAKGESMAVQVPKAVARDCCRGTFVIIIKGKAYPASGNTVHYTVIL